MDDKELVVSGLTYEQALVANKAAFEGKTKKTISKETGIPLTTLDKWYKDQNFVAYKNRIVIEGIEALKAENLSLLTKIIQARVAKIEDEDGDYSKLSDKDIVSLVETIQSLTKEDKKEEESNYSKKLEELLTKSQQKTIIINPEGAKSE